MSQREHSGRFQVHCCGKRRGYIPTRGDGALRGVLLCSTCDFNHAAASVVPNEHLVKDVPAKISEFYP